VWCAVGEAKDGVPTAESVNCVTREPAGEGTKLASLQLPGTKGLAGDVAGAGVALPANYKKFTSQDELGHFLLRQYKIRTPNDLASCEVCHR
jgi:hypothetical protein